MIAATRKGLLLPGKHAACAACSGIRTRLRPVRAPPGRSALTRPPRAGLNVAVAAEAPKHALGFAEWVNRLLQTDAGKVLPLWQVRRTTPQQPGIGAKVAPHPPKKTPLLLYAPLCARRLAWRR